MRKSIILKDGPYDIPVILFQQVDIVVACDINAQDSQPGIHEADHCWHASVADIKISIVKMLVHITCSELTTVKEQFQYDFAYTSIIATKILDQPLSYPLFNRFQYKHLFLQYVIFSYKTIYLQ